jgi:hypothetical protein
MIGGSDGVETYAYTSIDDVRAIVDNVLSS